MFGRGGTFYHPIYIDNLVDSFVLAQAEGVGEGEAYLIGDEGLKCTGEWYIENGYI